MFLLLKWFFKSGESVIGYILSSFHVTSELHYSREKNLYYYGLKILEPQVHQLKENH